MLEDREGSLWIGTAKEGLFRADPQAIAMYQHPDGSQWNVVEPVLQDRGGPHIGSGGRIGPFSSEAMASTENFYHVDKAFKRMAWDNIVSAIYEDRNGNDLVGPAPGTASPNERVRTLSGTPPAERSRAASTLFFAIELAIYGWAGKRALYRIHGGMSAPTSAEPTA